MSITFAHLRHERLKRSYLEYCAVDEAVRLANVSNICCSERTAIFYVRSKIKWRPFVLVREPIYRS